MMQDVKGGSPEQFGYEWASPPAWMPIGAVSPVAAVLRSAVIGAASIH